MVSDLQTLALFSGGGGLDLGFATAGFNVCISTDIDPVGCMTLKNNQGVKKIFPDHLVFPADVTNVDGKEVLSRIGKKPGEIDVVIGGPPCQSFSVFGKRRGLQDARGGLIWQFLRVIQQVKPKVFVFENVYGLASVNGGRVLKDLVERLSMGGKYSISVHIYEMAEHGVPQWRKRVFIIGVPHGMGKIPPLPKTHGDGYGLKPFNKVRDVLADMPVPGNDLPNHRMRNHGSVVVKRYQKMHFGMRDTKTRINRLHPDKPSFTIVVGSDKGGGKGHVHPFAHREVTPRESARIQTFPDWWVFEGNVRHMIRQVGNAVPPFFAAQLAAHLKSILFSQGKPAVKAAVLAKRLGIDFIKA